MLVIHSSNRTMWALVAWAICAVFVQPALGQWTRQTTAFNSNYEHLSSVQAWDNNLVTAVGAFGIIATTNNGGTTWTFDSRYGSLDSSLSAHYMLSNQTWVAVGQHGRILRTQNGGSTWQAVRRVSGDWLYGVFFKNNIGWAVGENGRVIRSNDFGATWSPLSITNPAVTLEAVWFNDNNIGFVVGTQGRIFKTVNGGSSWDVKSPAGFSKTLNAIMFPSPLIGFAAGDNGALLKTIDGGENWFGLSSTSQSLNSLWFVDENTGFVVGSNAYIAMSQNGGAAWGPQPSAFPWSGIPVRAVHFVKVGTVLYGWAVGNNRTIVAYNAPTGIPCTNRVGNGDFETGIDGWNTLNVSLEWEYYATNNYDCKATVTQGGRDIHMTYNLNSPGIQNGVRYRLRYDVRASRQLNLYAGIEKGATGISYGAKDWSKVATPNWTTFERTFVAIVPQGTATDARFVFNFGWQAGTNDVYYFDNVILDCAPAKEGDGSEVQTIPSAYALDQNFPNPFNPTTNISFSIPNDGMVTLKVFDLLGREVASLVNEVRAAGSYAESFDASALSSGTYFYRLESGSFVQTKRMLVLR